MFHRSDRSQRQSPTAHYPRIGIAQQHPHQQRQQQSAAGRVSARGPTIRNRFSMEIPIPSERETTCGHESVSHRRAEGTTRVPGIIRRRRGDIVGFGKGRRDGIAECRFLQGRQGDVVGRKRHGMAGDGVGLGRRGGSGTVVRVVVRVAMEQVRHRPVPLRVGGQVDLPSHRFGKLERYGRGRVLGEQQAGTSGRGVSELGEASTAPGVSRAAFLRGVVRRRWRRDVRQYCRQRDSIGAVGGVGPGLVSREYGRGAAELVGAVGSAVDGLCAEGFVSGVRCHGDAGEEREGGARGWNIDGIR
mmetsp:Transcript_7549/g.16314  ORF Transcript_7549/g.16314 Transcript_7549/m.16314 type:complete len:302 (-) Transcript_7549:701-1606(-)